MSVTGGNLSYNGSSELSLDSKSKMEPSVAIKLYQTKLNQKIQKSKVQETFWSKISLGQKILVKKILGQKNFGSQKI